MAEARDSRPDPHAVGHETAVRVRALTIGCSETRRMSFCQLDRPNDLRLPHPSGSYAKSLGFFSYLDHLYCLVSCLYLNSIPPFLRVRESKRSLVR